jgi:hypothetical protein
LEKLSPKSVTAGAIRYALAVGKTLHDETYSDEINNPSTT